MNVPHQNWTGASGQNYEYEVYPIGVDFYRVPGNYILAKRNGMYWEPIYIGESSCLHDRCCERHEKWALAQRHGATHIHAHVSSIIAQVRVNEETDLRRRFKPPCNDQ